MTRCWSISVGIVVTLVTLYDDHSSLNCVNGDLRTKVMAIGWVKLIPPSEVTDNAKDDYLLNLNLEDRRNLCIRMQKTLKVAFPRGGDNFYVPKTHYYHFGHEVNDNWAAIRCPYAPLFYISRGRIPKKNTPIWYILKMPIRVKYLFELETVKGVTLSARESDLSNMRMNERFQQCLQAAVSTRYKFFFNEMTTKLIGQVRIYEFDYAEWKHEFFAFACPTTPSMYLRLSDFDLLARNSNDPLIPELENDERRIYKSVMTMMILEDEIEEQELRNSSEPAQAEDSPK